MTILPLEWHVEKNQWQNPRIRALLGSVRSLDGVLESNFAILNCSPTRMLEIWDTVRQVCCVLDTEVTRLMSPSSTLPDLDAALGTARERLTFLESEVFVHIRGFPDRPEEHEFDALRRTLCVVIGKLHSFLVDTLGEILAADPRSTHDTDYFLARKFPRDVEEAEWLQTSVCRLDLELRRINADRHAILGIVIDEMRLSNRLPSLEAWHRLAAYLDALGNDFAPRLKGILGLRGIRIDELDVLEAHAGDLPETCRLIDELHGTARIILKNLTNSIADPTDTRDTGEAAMTIVEHSRCARIIVHLQAVEDELRDLAAFVPLWLRNVEQRRALMLRPKNESTADSGAESG